MKKAYIFVILFLILFCSIIVIINYNKKSNNSQIANPASVYCEEQEGVLEIRTNLDGSQSGYCIFLDGLECEEWAFYNGECEK